MADNAAHQAPPKANASDEEALVQLLTFPTASKTLGEEEKPNYRLLHTVLRTYQVYCTRMASTIHPDDLQRYTTIMKNFADFMDMAKRTLDNFDPIKYMEYVGWSIVGSVEDTIPLIITNKIETLLDSINPVVVRWGVVPIVCCATRKMHPTAGIDFTSFLRMQSDNAIQLNTQINFIINILFYACQFFAYGCVDRLSRQTYERYAIQLNELNTNSLPTTGTSNPSFDTTPVSNVLKMLNGLVTPDMIRSASQAITPENVRGAASEMATSILGDSAGSITSSFVNEEAVGAKITAISNAMAQSNDLEGAFRQILNTMTADGGTGEITEGMVSTMTKALGGALSNTATTTSDADIVDYQGVSEE